MTVHKVERFGVRELYGKFYVVDRTDRDRPAASYEDRGDAELMCAVLNTGTRPPASVWERLWLAFRSWW
jgi:hypothetical protein